MWIVLLDTFEFDGLKKTETWMFDIYLLKVIMHLGAAI